MSKVEEGETPEEEKESKVVVRIPEEEVRRVQKSMRWCTVGNFANWNTVRRRNLSKASRLWRLHKWHKKTFPRGHDCPYCGERYFGTWPLSKHARKCKGDVPNDAFDDQYCEDMDLDDRGVLRAVDTRRDAMDKTVVDVDFDGIPDTGWVCNETTEYRWRPLSDFTSLH